ncbi:MAG: glycine--tRNA ligase subunit beta [Acidobacteriota bacterium]
MTERIRPPHVFLLEVRTEEIPARMIPGAIRDLREGLCRALAEARLVPPDQAAGGKRVESFATPRRLAVRVAGVLPRQPDERIEVAGPPVSAAFDGGGRPTRAAEGFARAQGVKVSDLVRLRTPRGECVGARRIVRGRPAARVLAEVIPPAVMATSFPKTMRWGSGEHRFVRPIHSVAALLDSRPVPMTIAGVRAGRATSGLRARGRARVTLRSAAEYLDALRRGGVLADVDERRTAIQDQLRAAARAAGGRIAPPPGVAGDRRDGGDPELLEEVLHMVEWPTVICGRFDESFLDLPSEILVTAMRHHQKYFSLLGRTGRLLNRFLAVANARGDRRGIILRGNEWVLRARLQDARFFWQEDRRKRLEEHGAGLMRITFHERLGSYADKVARVARLAEAVLPAFREAGHPVHADAVARAVALCKNDLTTQMVSEFPELQGTVGAIYARADGEPDRVADAIAGHYLPLGPDSPIPPTPEGRVVAIADRLDTQAGIFLLGMIPTGSRDPYGLRRSTLGVGRILVDSRVHVSLSRLVGRALEGYAGGVVPGAAAPERARAWLLDFYRARLQHLGEEAGCRADSARAALSAEPDDPFAARLRMRALDAIRSGADFEALALAHKRIKNILRSQPACELDRARLREPAERALLHEIEAARPAVRAAVDRRDYIAALKAIARLRPALDRFFDEVLVMSEERAERENRLALLQSIAALFLEVVDLSEVAVEGEPVAAAASGRR